MRYLTVTESNMVLVRGACLHWFTMFAASAFFFSHHPWNYFFNRHDLCSVRRLRQIQAAPSDSLPSDSVLLSAQRLQTECVQVLSPPKSQQCCATLQYLQHITPQASFSHTRVSNILTDRAQLMHGRSMFSMLRLHKEQCSASRSVQGSQCQCPHCICRPGHRVLLTGA